MKKIICMILLLAMVLPVALPVRATEPAETTAATEPAHEVKEIYTVEDLQAMGEDPAGHYVLMNHLDMTGVEWKPVDLTGGSFDGNGYSILNLTITQVGDTTDKSYDGNISEYDTSFAGMFGILRNANIRNLNLVNVRGLVQVDVPCFLGGLTGAMFDSTVTDCSLSGILELRAHDRIFGLGGVAGYGTGAIERCQVDMTLICTDTDKLTRDEQFMGGAYATGYMDLVDCQVTVRGYASEYGFAHNGGLVGMMMQEPLAVGRVGKLIGNSVNANITFFVLNQEQRSHCRVLVGALVVKTLISRDNQEQFVKNQRYEYSRELRPEMCEAPVYTETVTAPGCDSFGYTEYTCQSCGYCYRDLYTLPEHTLTKWTITQEPTTEQEGISSAHCDDCGLKITRTEPRLEPLPTETTAPAEMPTEEPTEVPTEPTEPAEEAEQGGFPWKTILTIVAILAGVAATGFVILVLYLKLHTPKVRGKYER